MFYLFILIYEGKGGFICRVVKGSVANAVSDDSVPDSSRQREGDACMGWRGEKGVISSGFFEFCFSRAFFLLLGFGLVYGILLLPQLFHGFVLHWFLLKLNRSMG